MVHGGRLVVASNVAVFGSRVEGHDRSTGELIVNWRRAPPKLCASTATSSADQRLRMERLDRCHRRTATAGCEVECLVAFSQLASRRHPEFGEDLAEVPFHCARTDEQVAGDFGIGISIARQSGDVAFLGRQHRCRSVAQLFLWWLACGLEFAARPLGEAVGPHQHEPFVSDA
jgi:hypothetical protein